MNSQKRNKEDKSSETYPSSKKVETSASEHTRESKQKEKSTNVWLVTSALVISTLASNAHFHSSLRPKRRFHYAFFVGIFFPPIKKVATFPTSSSRTFTSSSRTSFLKGKLSCQERCTSVQNIFIFWISFVSFIQHWEGNFIKEDWTFKECNFWVENHYHQIYFQETKRIQILNDS